MIKFGIVFTFLFLFWGSLLSQNSAQEKLNFDLIPTDIEDEQHYVLIAEKNNKAWNALIYTNSKKICAKGTYNSNDFLMKNGEFEFYDTVSMKLSRVVNYYYNQEVGIYKVFWPNGSMSDSGRLYYNYPVGKWLSFHENGQLKYQAKFADSFETVAGITQAYDSKWEKAQAISAYLNQTFIRETRIGLWETFYDNGIKKDSVLYVKGDKTGEEKTWYKNGNLESVGNYTNNEVVGDWTWYHENGKKATEEIYVNNKLKALTCFDTSGANIGNLCGISRTTYFIKGDRALEKYLDQELFPKLVTAKPKQYIYAEIKINIDVNGIASLVDVSPNFLKSKFEAIKQIIAKMPNWQPAVMHNKIVPSKAVLSKLILY